MSTLPSWPFCIYCHDSGGFKGLFNLYKAIYSWFQTRTEQVMGGVVLNIMGVDDHKSGVVSQLLGETVKQKQGLTPCLLQVVPKSEPAFTVQRLTSHNDTGHPAQGQHFSHGLHKNTRCEYFTTIEKSVLLCKENPNLNTSIKKKNQTTVIGCNFIFSLISVPSLAGASPGKVHSRTEPLRNT